MHTRQDMNEYIAELTGESKRYVECRSRALLNLKEICQSEDPTLADSIMLLLITTLDTSIGDRSMGDRVLGLHGLQCDQDYNFLTLLQKAMATPDPQDWDQTKLILDHQLRFADLFLCEEDCPARRYHFGPNPGDISKRVHISGQVFRKLRKMMS